MDDQTEGEWWNEESRPRWKRALAPVGAASRVSAAVSCAGRAFVVYAGAWASAAVVRGFAARGFVGAPARARARGWPEEKGGDAECRI